MLKPEHIFKTLIKWSKLEDTEIIFGDIISIKRPNLSSVDIWQEDKLFGLFKKRYVKLEGLDKIELTKKEYYYIKEQLLSILR